MSRLIAIMFCCLVASLARADGCYIPQRAVLKIPEIPAQRAFISWKDGTETLIISSALDSESQKLGWVIPLPAVPDLLEKETPGALKSLQFTLQPIITHELYPGIIAAIIFTFLLNFLLATWLFKRHRFADLVTVLAILFILSGLMLPSLGSARGIVRPGSDSVRIEKTAAVGAYDVSVLRAKSASDLNDWLAQNGLSELPVAAEAIVTDYITNNWVFAAIVLAREQPGLNAPHPIRMSFRTAEAVYPMKLTAIAGGQTELELYVVADKRAVNDLFKVTYCDTFKQQLDADDREYETGQFYSGAGTKAIIGHPAIVRLMWDDCILSKMTATLPSGSMTDDIRFRWKPPKVIREHFYTRAGARETTAVNFVDGFGLFYFMAMIVYRKRIREAGGIAWLFGKRLIPAFGVIALASFVHFSLLPKLDASEIRVTRGRIYDYHAVKTLQLQIESLLMDHPYVLRGTVQEIEKFLLSNLKNDLRSRHAKRADKLRNEITGGELVNEDSPGNFTVEMRGTNVVVLLFEANGRARIISIPSLTMPSK